MVLGRPLAVAVAVGVAGIRMITILLAVAAVRAEIVVVLSYIAHGCLAGSGKRR